MLILEQIQTEEKTSLEDNKGTELEQDAGEEQDVSKATSIEGVELTKEAETEKD